MSHMTRLPILHFITELDAGGAQTVLFRLLQNVDRERYQPAVVCLYNGNAVMAQQIRKLDVPVLNLGMNAKWRIDALARLYRYLRQEQPTILHCWLVHADLIGRVIGRLAGVPIVITSRRNVEIGSAFQLHLKRWTTSLDDRIVAVCDLARQVEIEYSGTVTEKVLTIYNGIDPNLRVSRAAQSQIGHPSEPIRKEFSIPLAAPLIGTVGRLHPTKGHQDLIKAFAHLHTQWPDVYLLLVGDGEMRHKLIRQADDLQLSNRIIFTGVREDISSILATLNLFVLPSLSEGMPNVILEAMATGLPVVATSVGGVPELVVNGVTGILTPPNNPTALAEAILELLHAPEKAAAMGRAGRQRIKTHFTIDRMVEQYESLYQELAREKLNVQYVTGTGWT
jgi:sugar transferase (PEP-CTERM/EpsH1 system associated)